MHIVQITDRWIDRDMGKNVKKLWGFESSFEKTYYHHPLLCSYSSGARSTRTASLLWAVWKLKLGST